MIEKDALELSQALEAGDIRAVDVMRATLDRIGEVNGKVNAIVSLRDQDALMAEAAAADTSPRKGWLHGIPMAIKDLANAKGLPTTQGSPIFADQIAEQDDIMVARLKAAGAIVIGKTNTPEFGLGSHTFNPVHGTTRNPYDPSKTCGGSSGGAAVALATGMLAVADGSDMMGSLRNPAAWNNVYGMRPTWGAVPSEPKPGVTPDGLPQHRLSTNGPMARTPRDMAALLDTMAGPDPRQPFGTQIDKTLPMIGKPSGPIRVAWLGDWGGALPFEDGLISLSEDALAQMSDIGWQVEPISPPYSLDAIWKSWTDLRSVAVSDGLSGIYQNPALRDRLKQTAQWEIARGLAMKEAEIAAAIEIRAEWMRKADALFDTYDAVIMPSTQVWPFDMTEEYPRSIAGVQMDTYHRWMQTVIPAGLIGLPVVNIPIGFGQAGLPAGLQLIGRNGSDGHLLTIADQWHQATLWPQKRPGVC